MKNLSPKQTFIASKIKTAEAVKKKPQLSQRDSYANAMNRATRNGGSNGIGIGY